MADDPQLLRIPTAFQSVEALLAVAGRLDLPNAVLISEKEDGTLVLLSTDVAMAQTNWLLDRLKALMMAPEQMARR